MDKQKQIKYIAEQLFVQGNTDIIEVAFSTDYKAHTGGKIHTGHKFIKQFSKQIRKAIPDIKILKIDFLSETEEIITWQRTFIGTHKNNLKGIPSSNKKVKWYEIVVSRFHNDKIIEEWVSSDLAFQLMVKLATREIKVE